MKPAIPRVRVLPVVCTLLGLGLVGKTAVLGDHMLRRVSLSVGVPVAQAKEDGGGHGSTGSGEDHGAESKGGKKEAAPAACPPPPPPPEPTGPTFSETEIAVLQQLAQRRDDLNARESELQRKEALLQATEGRLDQKVADLKQLQATLEGLIRQHDGEQENKLQSLVKIYETMKPADAARIFEQLDMETLLPVVEKMKERKLAAILASLNPEKAKDVTVELKRLRELTATPKAGG